MKQQTQTLYKPKKEKVVPKPLVTRKDITFNDVMYFWGQVAWHNRVFLLVTFIVLENVLLLVRMG